MEDLPVKAIVIGVSVFVTMAVVSALILYFNTARQVVDVVNERTDIAETYDNIMNADVFNDTLTGVEIRSLINKYAGSGDVTINIVEISRANVTGYNNINNTWRLKKGDEVLDLISEQKLDLINPIWNCKVDKVKKRRKNNIRIEIKCGQRRGRLG